MSSQRDTFLFKLLEKAKIDKRIILASADMGAPAIDRWKSDLPDRFFSMGIAEANTINFCAGMSHQGYKPFIYSMGCWAMRCLEQIKYSCAMANNPITYLAAGVGLGYTPAGPAHAAIEDLGYMRSIAGIEIYSPANNNFVNNLVDVCCDDFKLRHIRLERSYSKLLDDYYTESYTKEFFEKGMCPIIKKNHNSICLVTSGNLLGRAVEVAKEINVDVVDLWKIKPIDIQVFRNIFNNYDFIITLEENILTGGFGSAICEVLCDTNLKAKIFRMGIPEVPNRYVMNNGTRDEILDYIGLGVNNIKQLVQKIINETY